MMRWLVVSSLTLVAVSCLANGVAVLEEGVKSLTIVAIYFPSI